MSASPGDEGEKSHEPTQQKLQKAREKGDVARSGDLSVAAAYGGFLLAAFAVGETSLRGTGALLITLFDQADEMAALVFEGGPAPVSGGVALHLTGAIAPWFAIPAIAVLASVVAQRALVFAPDRIRPKISRISPVANAKNKFGRHGFFEFGKSFLKLLLYSTCLSIFLRARLPDLLQTVETGPRACAALLVQSCLQFLIQ